MSQLIRGDCYAGDAGLCLVPCGGGWVDRQIDGWMEQQEGGLGDFCSVQGILNALQHHPDMAKTGTPTLWLAGTASYCHHAEADSGFPCARDERERARAPRLCCCFIDVSLFNA